MALSREHLEWVAALLLEKRFGEAAFDVIDRKIRHLIEADDVVGVEMWHRIAERYMLLRSGYETDDQNERLH